MCYTLLLSTTSIEDLNAQSNEFVRFSRELPSIADVKALEHPNRWYVGSKSGCSCTFRHLYSIELGFGEPVDWYPEESEEIEATLQLIGIIRKLIESGESVDCVDAWEHQNMHPVAKATLEVDLCKVSDQEFRFFENHHFKFKNAI
jgi:hypothetical protein